MSALYDAPGPVTRRRHFLLGVLASVGLVAIFTLVVIGLARAGQFSSDLWAPILLNGDLHRGLGLALLGTLRVAAVAMVLSLALGLLLAVGRLSKIRLVSAIAAATVWFFRGPPLLVLILFFYLGFPYALGIDLSAFWALVLALMLYNGSVFAEIFRAGVLSLPRGQSEAGSSLGLSRAETMRLILLPQAIRAMLPAIISQLVVLLKDTSLGFVVSYFELLRYGNTAIEILQNPIQMYLCIAAIFIVINYSLSRLATMLERRGLVTSGSRGLSGAQKKEQKMMSTGVMPRV
jgi:glutamate transport system permease protein